MGPGPGRGGGAQWSPWGLAAGTGAGALSPSSLHLLPMHPSALPRPLPAAGARDPPFAASQPPPAVLLVALASPSAPCAASSSASPQGDREAELSGEVGGWGLKHVLQAAARLQGEGPRRQGPGSSPDRGCPHPRCQRPGPRPRLPRWLRTPPSPPASPALSLALLHFLTLLSTSCTLPASQLLVPFSCLFSECLPSSPSSHSCPHCSATDPVSSSALLPK